MPQWKGHAVDMERKKARSKAKSEYWRGFDDGKRELQKQVEELKEVSGTVRNALIWGNDKADKGLIEMLDKVLD
jgi:hypothetical protein